MAAFIVVTVISTIKIAGLSVDGSSNHLKSVWRDEMTILDSFHISTASLLK